MAKSKHKLWNTWKQAKMRGVLCSEWDSDFWAFVSVIGERRLRHRIERIDRSKQLGPGNWYWREPISDAPVGPDRARYNRLYYTKNVDYHRNRHYKKKYGITSEQYDALLSSQGGVCAICEGEEKIANRRTTISKLSVDHCHETGRIRGLLCHSCNTAIGKMSDSPQRLRVAAEYLERHQESK